MLVETSNLYITDKTGKKSFKTVCSTAYVGSEIKNLQLKLDHAQQCPDMYKFLDVNTARILVDGEALNTMSDEELLNQLDF